MSQSSDLKSSDSRWQELHLSLQDMLAGYVDHELDEQEILIVEAHLAGCKTCRDDLARQQLLSQQLGALSVERIPASLSAHLDAVTDSEAVAHKTHRKHFEPLLWLENLLAKFSVSATGWALSCVLVAVMMVQNWPSSYQHNIPMVQDALSQYQTIQKAALPVSNEGFDLPVTWPEGQLLSSWETSIGGAPAQAFAVRNGSDIIFQYRIDQNVLFRNPEVRAAIANQGSFVTQENGTEIRAIPMKASGLLMVGPSKAMPADERLKFNSI